MAQRPRRLHFRRAAWADQRQPLQGTDRARCVWRAGEQLEPVLSRLRLLKACGERWRFAWSTAWLLSTVAPSSSHRSTARGGWRAKLGVRAKLLRVQWQVWKRRSEQWLHWREENEEQAAARRRSPHHGRLVTSISGAPAGSRARQWIRSLGVISADARAFSNRVFQTLTHTVVLSLRKD